MSSFIIALINIQDRERYSEYESGFMETFSRYAGRLVSVDDNPRVLEGNCPSTRTVLIEFPDDDAAMAWYGSDEYQRLAEHRFASAEGKVVLIKGIDDGEG